MKLPAKLYFWGVVLILASIGAFVYYAKFVKAGMLNSLWSEYIIVMSFFIGFLLFIISFGYAISAKDFAVFKYSKRLFLTFAGLFFMLAILLTSENNLYKYFGEGIGPAFVAGCIAVASLFVGIIFSIIVYKLKSR